MNVLAQNIQPMGADVNQPDKCVISDEFERFIRKRLFPLNKYDLVLKTADPTAEKKVPAEYSKEPHFKLKSRDNGLEFFVDAKYIFSNTNSMVEWCKQYELKRYQELDQKTPVYIVIGNGPSPAAPRQVYFFPVRNVRFNKLLRTSIEKYKISVTRAVEEKDLL